MIYGEKFLENCVLDEGYIENELKTQFNLCEATILNEELNIKNRAIKLKEKISIMWDKLWRWAENVIEKLANKLAINVIVKVANAGINQGIFKEKNVKCIFGVRINGDETDPNFEEYKKYFSKENVNEGYDIPIPNLIEYYKHLFDKVNDNITSTVKMGDVIKNQDADSVNNAVEKMKEKEDKIKASQYRLLHAAGVGNSVEYIVRKEGCDNIEDIKNSYRSQVKMLQELVNIFLKAKDGMLKSMHKTKDQILNAIDLKSKEDSTIYLSAYNYCNKMIVDCYRDGVLAYKKGMNIVANLAGLIIQVTNPAYRNNSY